MLREKVGSVTEEEKKEILVLYERKLALQELFLTLTNPSLSEENKAELYEKIVNDMSKTKRLFDEWWNKKAIQYAWKSKTNGQWNIDFITNEISMIINE